MIKRNIAALAAFIGLILSGCSDDDSAMPVNKSPVANPDTASLLLDSKEHIDVLDNDHDPEGETLTLTQVSIEQGSGRAIIDNNKIWFIADTLGTTIVNYSVTDPEGATAQTTLTIEVLDPQQQTAHFIGSQTCVTCHTDKDTFFETGHNFKLNKVVDGKAPEYPFSNLEGAIELMYGANNSLGTPESWEDISYVIGGYDTWANFLDKDGFILSGTGVAVSMPSNGDDISINHIQGYKPDSAPDSQPFDCGLCHSTGWKDYTPDSNLNPNHQDGLKGIAGTFNQAGIQCEACHGAGSIHIKTTSPDDISRIAQGRLAKDLTKEDMGFGLAITCSECHSKQTNRHYPDFISEHNKVFGGDTIGGRAIPYFDGGRLAGDQMLGLDANTGEAKGKKRNMACHTCHNPHRSKANEDQPGHEDAMVKNCVDCHGEKSFNSGLEVHEVKAACTTCHMPKSNHFFKINLALPSNSPEHMSTDGQFVQPWNTAKDSCGGCHKDFDELAVTITQMHK